MNGETGRDVPGDAVARGPAPGSPPGSSGSGAPARLILNAARGALIGTAETIPGVSGGTIALMTGIYETLLTSAGHAIAAARLAVTDGLRGRGLSRSRGQAREVSWWVILPVGAGMVVALLGMAHVMEDLLGAHPEVMRAFFAGLVVASLAVPYRHARRASTATATDTATGHSPESRWRPREWMLAAAAAAAIAAVLSLPGAHLEPAPAILVVAGALAVSALVLPGLSGSFLLLTLGLYEPTLAALNSRDLGYLGFFAAGAVVGLVTVVKVLQALLERRRRVTLVVLTGIMAGSLVALWPWQDAAGANTAPTGSLVAPTVALLTGIVLVAAVLAAEARLSPRA